MVLKIRKEIESYWSFVISHMSVENIESALKSVEGPFVSEHSLTFHDEDGFTWMVKFTRTSVRACRLLYNEHTGYGMLDIATTDGASLPIEVFKQRFELESFVERLLRKD